MTLPAWSAFEDIPAADLQAMVDAISNLRAPGWTDWVSSIAWTSSGTAPALGNATKTAAYRRPTDADVLEAWMLVTFGSTSTFGTGVYFWALPFTAHSSMVGLSIGVACAVDTGTLEYSGVVYCNSTTTARMMPASNSGDDTTNWGPADPFTFGNTDKLGMFVKYRPA